MNTLTRLARSLAAAAAALAVSVAACAASVSWDVPTVLDSSASFAGPAFDSAGNAYVLSGGAPAGGVRVFRSSGASNSWSELPAPPVVTATALFGAPVIDASGVLTFAYFSSQPENGLYALRYVPGVGWTDPVLLSTTAFCCQNTPPHVDPQGNVIIVFNALNSSSVPDMVSAVYVAAEARWRPLVTVAAGTDVDKPRLAQSPDGSQIVLAFNQRGTQVARFRSGTLDWSAPQTVPGTQLAVDKGDHMLLAAVDNQGDVSLLDGFVVANRIQSLWGIKQAGTRWNLRSLIGWADKPWLTSAGNAVVNSRGDVMAFFLYGLSDSQTEFVGAFRTSPGTGWSTGSAASWFGLSSSQMSGAWLGDSGQAVVVYYNQGDGRYESSFNDGTGWTPLPLGTVAVNPWLGTTPGGDVLMICSPGSQGLAAQWLRRD